MTVSILLMLGGNRRSAVTAPQQPGIRERMSVRLWHGLDIKNPLGLVEVLFGDHRLVRANIQHSVVSERPVVERIAKQVVNGRSGEWSAVPVASDSIGEAPVLDRSPVNFSHGILARQQVLPHPLHYRESFGILDDGLRFLVVPVTEGSALRQPPLFQFGAIATLHVIRQIVHIFLGHAEFELEPKFVIPIIGQFALRGEDSMQRLFIECPDERAAIYGIASQTVQLPAEDGVELTRLDGFHEFGEYRPSGGFGRFTFREYRSNGPAFGLGVLPQFPNLRINGKNLSVFRFGRFAGINGYLLHTG